MNTCRVGTFAALAILVLVGAAFPVSAGECIHGHVPFPFVLPDGSSHTPGDFTACTERRLTPMKTLQQIAVSGVVQGWYVAEVLQAEESAAGPYLTFSRQQDGDWVLVGITVPATADDRYGVTYRLLPVRPLTA